MAFRESRVEVPLRHRDIAVPVVLGHLTYVLVSELAARSLAAFLGRKIIGVVATPAIEEANAVADLRVEAPS